jgi:hypothetical protein
MITPSDLSKLHIGFVLHHTTATNSDGTPLRARVNGAVKTWKTRPGEFSVPMKHGLRSCFYLTQDNAEDWAIPSVE